MSTWRIYIASFTCPNPLVRAEKVCEKIAFGKQLFPLQGKSVPIPTERPRFFSVNVGHAVQKQEPLLLPLLQLQNQRRQHQNGICGRLKTIDLPISNLEEATTILKRKLSDQISLEFNSRSDIKPPGTPQLPQQSLPLLQFKRETISTKNNGTNGVGLEYNHADGSFMRKTSLYGAILKHGVKSTAYFSTWFW